MRFRLGYSHATSSGDWTKPEIELFDSDLELLCVELDLPYDRLSITQRYALMAAKAEHLLAIDQFKRRFIEREQFDARASMSEKVYDHVRTQLRESATA